MEVMVRELKALVGDELMDVELLEGTYTSSGADKELVLRFRDEEVIIYQLDNGTICVEVD